MPASILKRSASILKRSASILKCSASNLKCSVSNLKCSVSTQGFPIGRFARPQSEFYLASGLGNSRPPAKCPRTSNRSFCKTFRANLLSEWPRKFPLAKLRTIQYATLQVPFKAKVKESINPSCDLLIVFKSHLEHFLRRSVWHISVCVKWTFWQPAFGPF